MHMFNTTHWAESSAASYTAVELRGENELELKKKLYFLEEIFALKLSGIREERDVRERMCVIFSNYFESFHSASTA